MFLKITVQKTRNGQGEKSKRCEEGIWINIPKGQNRVQQGVVAGACEIDEGELNPKKNGRNKGI